MKKRNSWVSNSSSSSFICEVCGEECGGMDIGLSDCGMDRCENEHVICERHKLDSEEERTPEQKKEIVIAQANKMKEFYLSGKATWYTEEDIANLVQEEEDWINEVQQIEGDELAEWFEYGEGYDWWLDWESEHGFSSEYCPICQFQVGRPQDMLAMVLDETGDTREEVLRRMKEKYGTYRQAKDALRF